jgi:NADPH:quinone reductase-like Zn-dependent oxidoreductase
MPTTRKAFVLDPFNKTIQVESLPIPTLTPTTLLGRVHAVAVNPADALFTRRPIATQKRIVDSGFAGEVVVVPDALRGSTDPRCRVGARVAGFFFARCNQRE